MIPPVIPENGLIVIASRHSRVFICQFIEVQPFVFEMEDALNWRELEESARRFIESQIGAITEDDIFHCPPSLADRAEWK